MAKTKDKFHFDPVRHKYTLNGIEMTGVTTVLGVINKPALVGWAANMAIDYATENAIGKQSTINDGDVYLIPENTLKSARTAHNRRKEARGKSGGDTHKQIEELIKVAMEGFEGYIQQTTIDDTQLQNFVNWAIDHKVQFLESEKVMYHPDWFVGGTVDFVARIGGKKYIGDIKTQKKIWDRVPFFQMAAYRGMLESMGEKGFHGSVIVHLPEEGVLEDHYSFDYESDLDAFLAALKLYRALNN